MTQKTTAERCYDAFVAALEWSDAPAFHDLEDKGEAWCRVANARDELLAPPKTAAPYAYELTEPVIRRYLADGSLVKERLPSSLPIRPLVAGDLCHPESDAGGEAYELAIQASVHGVKRRVLEEQVDPVDVEMAMNLLKSASGIDASVAVRDVFGLSLSGAAHADLAVAWVEVCHVLFIEDAGKHMLVQCRTPGLGTVKVGPYLIKHKRVHRDTASKSNEWEGRLAALALATGKTVAEIKSARIEDAMMLWHAFESLKKKASEASMYLFLRHLSVTSSDSESETSTTGPSTS